MLELELLLALLLLVALLELLATLAALELLATLAALELLLTLLLDDTVVPELLEAGLLELFISMSALCLDAKFFNAGSVVEKLPNLALSPSVIDQLINPQ